MLRGADDETRTRDINLGKVALYQLSYVRRCDEDVTPPAQAGVKGGQASRIVVGSARLR